VQKNGNLGKGGIQEQMEKRRKSAAAALGRLVPLCDTPLG
jgi:hypothetical protein